MLIKLLLLNAIGLAAGLVQAQSLPQPSRTVYKCVDGGKVYYSDSPCLGAKKIEIEPTRGLNKYSGKVQEGQDVQRERFHEGLAEAVRPITGQDAKQIETAGRRAQLPLDQQRECRRLDQEIPMAEQAEKVARPGDDLRSSQVRLLELRRAFRSNRC